MNDFLTDIPTLDFSAPVVYLPVRHHSPACAFHVAQTLRRLKPAAVLIEGPHDATELIPLLTHPDTKPPVAIFTTCVQKITKDDSLRFSAYYPMCDYSPELVAIRTAAELGAECEFIDLGFAEMNTLKEPQVERSATCGPPTTSDPAHGPQITRRIDFLAAPLEALSPLRPDNLLADRYSQQNRFLEAACRQTGTRDADDLWDQLYELDYRDRESNDFFRNVLAYCTLMRKGQTPESLIEDGTQARENAMRQRIEECAKKNPKKQIAVITGGFHTVAFLDKSSPPCPRASVREKNYETQINLIRYGFEQLDRLNGYASGMPAPEFYQLEYGRPARTFSIQNAGGAPTLHNAGGTPAVPGFIADLVVELGRICRKENFAISTADEIAAMVQIQRLAELRGHPNPSREDFCDAIRSVFVKGADDSDGLPVLALCRKLLAGNRVGQIPAEAGQPPIVEDFQRQMKELRVVTELGTGKEITLDLYRKRRDRAVSRFFRQLEFLEVPFADWKQGPNFVAGEELHRIREIWNYRWTPDTESTLITRSVYGSTVREAASELLLENFHGTRSSQLGTRAPRPQQSNEAVKLLVSACLMGLHDKAADMLDGVKTRIAEDSVFVSLVQAMGLLIGLHVSREPLEAHDLTELNEMALTAYHRACFLIPELAATAVGDEETVVDALCALSQAVLSLENAEEQREVYREELWEQLQRLAQNADANVDANAVVRGATVGLLYGDGQFDTEELLKQLRGELHGSKETSGPDFLYGLLKTARFVLWQVPECVDTLHELLRDWDEDRFVKLLPLLRLAFSSLTPQECDRLAKIVADRYAPWDRGRLACTAPRFAGFTEHDLLLAARVNLAVKEILHQDGF